MSISVQKLEELLHSGFPEASIDVDGDGYHYQVKITTESFEGLSKIKRHKKIYEIVDGYIKDGSLHALSIDAKTPDERMKQL